MSTENTNTGAGFLLDVNFKAWDVTWTASNPNETGHKKFLHHNPTTGSYYYKGQAMLAGHSMLSMKQTRKVTVIVFADDMVGEAIAANMDLPADSPLREINAETGKQKTPIWGDFVDIYVGMHNVTWTNDKGETRTDPISTRSQFIAEGDNVKKVYDRVTRQVAKDPNWVKVKQDDKVADKVNEQMNEQ